MNTYYLEPKHTGCKSFYGKARVIDRGHGVLELQSYDTIVARITDGTEYEYLWDGRSATTTRHVNEFKAQFLES